MAPAVPLLCRALEILRGNDSYLSFDAALETPRTAMMEVLESLARLGPRAAAAREFLERLVGEDNALAPDVRHAVKAALEAIGGATRQECCQTPPSSMPPTHDRDVDLRNVQLEDQGGRRLAFGKFFDQRAGILTFFYTRCANPEKCSLTISKIARLQRRVSAAGITPTPNVAAISYDPEYDTAARLHAYGRDRGMRFDDHSRLLRIVGHFDILRHAFDLGVGYGPSTVNQHRTELYVFDPRGRMHADFVRVDWQEDDVLAALIEATTANRSAKGAAEYGRIGDET
jgi:cytochrome oxidase Cu insertion factor (SCO1/SenC/PrrC family)